MNEESIKPKFHIGLMWSLTILLWVLYIIWSLNWIGHNDRTFSTILVIACQLLCWLVFIIDILRSDIYNKAAWIIMIMITPLITFPVYLFQKKRLLNLQRKKERFTQK